MRYRIALFLIALTVCGPVAADDDDHDRARRAVEQGRILPLRDILELVDAQYPGQLIEAELEDEHGALNYEIKILTRDGRVMKLLYDAQTGELLRAKGRDGQR